MVILFKQVANKQAWTKFFCINEKLIHCTPFLSSNYSENCYSANILWVDFMTFMGFFYGNNQLLLYQLWQTILQPP